MSTKKFDISRRYVLQGLGTALALPVLEIMLPSMAKAAGTGKAKRLGFMSMPNGPAWRDYKLLSTPVNSVQALPASLSIGLQDLNPYRDYLTVVSGMDVPKAYQPYGTSEVPDGHLSMSTTLNCDSVRSVDGGNSWAGSQSMDQIIAATVGVGKPKSFFKSGNKQLLRKSLFRTFQWLLLCECLFRGQWSVSCALY